MPHWPPVKLRGKMPLKQDGHSPRGHVGKWSHGPHLVLRRPRAARSSECLPVGLLLPSPLTASTAETSKPIEVQTALSQPQEKTPSQANQEKPEGRQLEAGTWETLGRKQLLNVFLYPISAAGLFCCSCHRKRAMGLVASTRAMNVFSHKFGGSGSESQVLAQFVTVELSKTAPSLNI